MKTPGRESVLAAYLVEEFRLRLHELRRTLGRTVVMTDEELATLERHRAGSVDDAAAAKAAIAVLSQLEGQERHELDEIDAARARLEAGSFGVCEHCAKPIPVARLRAMPTARYCLDCQQQQLPPP